MENVLDHEFRLYRCYQLPTFTETQREHLSSLVAQYLFLKYSSATTDPSPKYRKAEDIKVVANSAKEYHDGVGLSCLTLKHALASQVVVFIENGSRHIALVKSSTPIFVVQALESLDSEVPLILSPIKVLTASILECFNEFERAVSGNASSLGDVELTFSPSKPLKDNSLKEMIIEIPLRDMREINAITGQSLKPIERVLRWLERTTTVKFENLETRGFRCALVAMSVDRLKFARSIPLDLVAKFVIATINGLHVS